MKIHEVQEESPYSWLKRKTSHTIHKDQYSRAASKLHDILSRKHKETGGKLRHSLGYYAHMLSRQTGERLNWKELAQEYLDTFGGTYFENFDLDEFKIVKPDPKDTMGIKRNQMPQVATKDYPEFVEYLKDKGATFTKDTVKATSLKAIQGEFSDQGVEKQLKKLMNKEPKKPVIASSDDYIIDGHHRWLVALNTGDTVDVFRVDVPGQELLQLVKEFPKVTYKDIYNERLVLVDPKGPKNLKKLKKPSRYERRKQAAKAQDDIDETWSKKYKKSIDCSNPKGFSQKAHCAGRKKTEAFDNPYKLDYDDDIEGYDQTMSVQLPDKTYLTITFNNEGNNQWVVEFYRANTQELTGQGDAQRIFATVIDAIQKFIKKQKPASLYFSADKMVEPGQNAESRAKLYSGLVKRYASALGYDSKIDDQGDQVTYTLKRLQEKNFGIPDGATLAQLDDIAKNAKTKEKRQRAHYLRNMRRGQNKTK